MTLLASSLADGEDVRRHDLKHVRKLSGSSSLETFSFQAYHPVVSATYSENKHAIRAGVSVFLRRKLAFRLRDHLAFHGILHRVQPLPANSIFLSLLVHEK